MKKIFNYIIIILMLFIYPLNALACPHVDSDGNAHFQFYNSDYTIMTMMYPRENYFYAKDIPLPEEFVMNKEVENNILNEEFSFPLVQDKETYWSNYWFIKNELMRDDWRSKEYKTTVEGIDYLKVDGKDYILKVGLKNTYSDSKRFHNMKNITQMLYNIKVDKLNEDKNEVKYKKIVEDNKFDLDIPEIFKIDFEYYILTMEKDNYKEKKEEFKTLYDDITIKLKSTKLPEDIVAVNLDKAIDEDNQIPVVLNKDGYYEYTIKESGVYVLLRKNSFRSSKLDKLNSEKKEIEQEVKKKQEESNKNSYTIFGLILVSIIVIGFFVIKGLNNNNNDNNDNNE